MLFDLIDLTLLRRAVLYALLLGALFLTQDLLLAHLPLFGVRPLLLPAACAAVGLYDGGLWGGIFGLAAGALSAMGGGGGAVMLPLSLGAVGFFSGVLGQYLFRRGLVSCLVLSLGALALVTFCQMFRFLFFTDTDNAAVWRVGLLQIAWSLPWSVPISFPCRAIAEQDRY